VENFEPGGRRLEHQASSSGTWSRSTTFWLSTMLIAATVVGCRGGSSSSGAAGSPGSGGATATATGGGGGNRGIGTGGISTTGAGGTAGTVGTGPGGGGGTGAGTGGNAGPGGGGAGTSSIGGASAQGGSAGTNAGGSPGSAGKGVGGRGGAGTAGGGPAGGTTGSGGAGPIDAGSGDTGDARALPPITDARAADAAVCVELAQLQLGTPVWTVDENLTFVERAPVAGVQSRLVIPLSNPTPSITTSSPAILLTSTTPGVSGTGRYELFGIAANKTASLIWLINFDSPLAPGSVAHFQADVYGQDLGRVRCEDSPSLSFDVTLN